MTTGGMGLPGRVGTATEVVLLVWAGKISSAVGDMVAKIRAKTRGAGAR
jgi:hypothetical protein